MTVIVVSFFESVFADHSKDHAVAVAYVGDTLTGSRTPLCRTSLATRARRCLPPVSAWEARAPSVDGWWSETAIFEGAPPASGGATRWGISVSRTGEIQMSAVTRRPAGADPRSVAFWPEHVSCLFAKIRPKPGTNHRSSPDRAAGYAVVPHFKAWCKEPCPELWASHGYKGAHSAACWLREL